MVGFYLNLSKYICSHFAVSVQAIGKFGDSKLPCCGQTSAGPCACQPAAAARMTSVHLATNSSVLPKT